MVSTHSNAEILLHVENDSDDVFLTQRAFRKAGVNSPLHAVENGEQAVAFLLGHGRFANRTEHPLPSVILLDWNMPLMSGSDFLVWLRKQERLRRLPVVVLTSSNSQQDIAEAAELGANGFVTKPRTLESFQVMVTAFAEYWLKWNRSDFSQRREPVA
jgi:CheY-like chemotaxis protein